MTFKSESALREEKWNAYSHGLGVVLALVGSTTLLQKDIGDTPYLFGSILVYCISVVLLFTASTLYHSVQDPRLKKKLRALDHISIYYLIAGTYTPVCLTVLLPSKGWLLFFLVWGIALFGTVLKLFFTGKFEVFSLVLYGVMGWLIVIDVPYLVKHLSPTGLFYLSLGGAFYTLGIVFYAIKRIPYNHLIWHLFVLSGAMSHWYLVSLLFGDNS
ncbi:hemolysin III family protein [Flagellimonas alvinocaridis]|uniref:Hemolysin III family protein n=1 Tax=Flagellimonas alvinocaridis TaxID=2530200 RepID=A0A4S8RU86_9FLAO|nr:hemolysin III family protein [Allomuricauda alvinocaridis]THV58779.1 hemolysin III family protein [Allomuricauda alvinocaridis]